MQEDSRLSKRTSAPLLYDPRVSQFMYALVPCMSYTQLSEMNAESTQ